MVEAAGDLSGDLDVRGIVLADGDDVRPDAEDVGRLQDGVSEQPVGHFVLARVAGHVLSQ